jgi:hypothetical protein
VVWLGMVAGEMGRGRWGGVVGGFMVMGDG